MTMPGPIVSVEIPVDTVIVITQYVARGQVVASATKITRLGDAPVEGGRRDLDELGRLQAAVSKARTALEHAGRDRDEYPWSVAEPVEVLAYPDDLLHLHGKAMSGLRHSHPLKPGEDRDEPWHDHEGEWDPTLATGAEDRRGVGAALYFPDRMNP